MTASALPTEAKVAEEEPIGGSSASGRQHNGNLVLEGTLEKKGGGTSFIGHTNYKSRYFKLYEKTAKSPRLFFYADAEGAQKGNVPLAVAIITPKEGSADEFNIGNTDEDFRSRRVHPRQHRRGLQDFPSEGADSQREGDVGD